MSVTLFLCGDVMTGRGIDQVLPHPGNDLLHEPHMLSARGYVGLAERAHGAVPAPVDFDYVWGEALDVLAEVAPDKRIINLETSITRSDDFWRGKLIHYRMHPANGPVLTAAGIDTCVLANNHVLDWGYPGLNETLATLDDLEIAYAGAGNNATAAGAPALLPLPGGGRVLLFAFGLGSSGIPGAWAATTEKAGVNRLPLFLEDPLRPREEEVLAETVTAIQRQVTARKEPGDVAVASIHWGGNWGYEIPAGQQRFARRLIDNAGIDVVHGHSSHHVKGIEVYRERLILYGCGDLLTDYEGIKGYETYRDDLGLLYFPELDGSTGRLLALDMVPTRLRRLQLQHAPEADVAWLATLLNREGEQLATRVRRQPDNRLSLVWSNS